MGPNQSKGDKKGGAKNSVLESHEKQGAKELKQNYVIDNNKKPTKFKNKKFYYYSGA